MIVWSDNQHSKVSVGYGYVPDRLYPCLEKSGLPIERRTPETPEEFTDLFRVINLGYFSEVYGSDKILINHSMPEAFVKSSLYSIGFTYWETNRLPDDWVKNCNKMDEVWTSSRFMQDVFVKSGVKVPVYGFNLGVEPALYSPLRRYAHNQFTFLSMGSPSTRKNSQVSVDAFLKLFGGNDEYRLIYKSNGAPDARNYANGVMMGRLDHPQIEIIDEELSHDDLAKLYDEVDCLLYPTSGEGWGIIPFQAIAKGIPTICTNATACEEYAYMSVPLDYEWSQDKMSGIYENAGFWAKPNFDDLCDKMLYVVNNYDKVSKKTFSSAEYINKNMTWEKVSKDYVNRLCQILKDTKAKH
jgi:glycosyltransferase involved in cell wall biosynthesis